MSASLLPTAVAHVRAALRQPPIHQPDPIDELEAQINAAGRWALVVEAHVRHLDARQRVTLIQFLSQLGAWIAEQLPEDDREALLSRIAQTAEAT